MPNDEQFMDSAVALTQDLVRISSNSGQEKDAADLLAQRMETLGFDAVERDRYGSVVGVIQGNRPGKTVLLDGHLDTVPVTNQSSWQYNPFGAEIVDGRLYGRGSTDMKGPLAAMTCGAAMLAAHSRDFAGKLLVAGVVHEEIFEGIASRVVSTTYSPDYVVIGEPSGMEIKRGQRGRAEIQVRTLGKTAHSANPQLGRNAVLMMTQLIQRISAITPPTQDALGKGICVITDIISDPYPGASVVPGECRITLDRRLLVGETLESVLVPIREAIDACVAHDPEFQADVSYTRGKETCYTNETIEGKRFFPGWLAEEDAPHVQAAKNALQSVGITTKISNYPFCTNGSHYAGEMGIPTIGFGPSKEDLAHVTDEYIELDQLKKAVVGYAAIAKALLDI